MDHNIVDKVVNEEWEQFQSVQNIGGRADCQDDRWTFEIMRKSQYRIWSDQALESYLEDLCAAKEKGRNLLTEKYAYMMEDTSPEEFEKIRKQLPAISEEKKDLVRKLTEMQVNWREDFQKRFPKLSGQGRPIRQTDAPQGMASIETYARGELCTYSEKTLRCLQECFSRCAQEMNNPCEAVMEYMVRAYGYESLEDAEGRNRS